MFAQGFEYLDGVGLFAIATARLKPHMTLVTQHKPIERSTNMVFMTKKSQIQVWLNSLYTEIRYRQRVTSKHVRAGRRPGTGDIKTQPNLASPLAHQTIRRSRYFASQSKSDLPAHDSVSSRSACFIMFLLLFFR